MKKQLIKFFKGLNKDVHPLDSAQGFYEDARGVVHLSKLGEFFQLNNEQGNRIVSSINSSVDGDNYLVIGREVIENSIILFSVNEAGTKSEVGVFDCDTDTYTTYVNNGLGQTTVLTAPPPAPAYSVFADDTTLGFDINNPIKATSRKLFNNDTAVYFTDGATFLRVLNLDNLPLSDIGDNSDLFISQRPPICEYVETLEYGNLEVGRYQFAARYLNENFDPVYFGIVSNPVPVVENNRSEGRNKYDGNIPGTNAAKSVVIDVTNLDNSYRYVELVVISFVGAGDTANAFIYQRKPIIDDTVRFIFSDKDESLGAVSLDEISLIRPNYLTCRAITQKDGHLILSNLSSLATEDFQSISNKIRLKYEVQQIPYIDVVEGVGAAINDPQMQLIGVYRLIDLDANNAVIPNNDVYFVFNKPVDPISSSVNNFALVKHEFIPGGPNFLETISYPVVVSAASNTVKCTFSFPTTSLNMGDYTDLVTDPVYTYAVGTLIGDAPYTWANDNGLAQDIAELGNLANTTTKLGEAITYARTANITTPPLQFTIGTAFPTPLIAGNTVEIYGVVYTDARQITAGGPLVYDITGPDLGAEAGVGIQAFLSPDIFDFNVDNAVPNTNTLNNKTYFGDYVDEGVCFSLKTYMREENYSLALQAIFKNGGKTPALHIPGNNRSTLVTTEATVEEGLASGYLGTYVSDGLYPAEGGYPSSSGTGSDFSADGRVRHHRMPTQNMQPIFAFANNSFQIRILRIKPVWGEDFAALANGTNITFDSTSDIEIGTEVVLNGFYKRTIAGKAGGPIFTYTLNAPIPVAVTAAKWEKTIKQLLESFPSAYKQVQGISFLRQRRDKTRNRSVVMQGIAQKLLYHTGSSRGRPYLSNTYFFGKTRIQPSTRVFPRHEPKAAFGYPGNAIDYLCSFYSPDTLLLNREVPTGAFIKPVSEISGTIYGTARVLFNGKSRRSGGYHAFANYNTYASLGGLVVSPKQILRSQTVDSDFETLDFVPGTPLPQYPALPKIINYINEGYVLLDLGTGNALQDTAPAGPEIDIILAASAQGGGEFDEYQEIQSSTGFVSRRYLYNIYVNNTEQYGDVSSAEYSIAYTLTDLASSGAFSFAGGDIFISKFSCKNSNNWRWALNYQINGNETSSMRNARTGASSNEEGEELRGLMYFFAESEVNCNYRHQPVQLNDQGEPVGFGVPYYPNNPIISDVDNIQIQILNINLPPFTLFKVNGTGVLDIAPTLGDSDGYNPAYSADAVIDTQSSLPFGFKEVTDFRNRTIYSQRSLEGEQSDRYRFFLANDVHDIPKNTGEITENFVFNGVLWLHTEKSLWRTFFNEVTAIPSSSGDLFLGNGGLFPRPSIEVFTTLGGYAGCQSRFAGVNTPFGRFFLDYDQRRLFLLKGESVEELPGSMSRWLLENIPFSTGNGDNPYDPFSNGYTAGYDYKTNRFLLTKSTRDDTPWTISWSPQVGNYVSFHAYIPNMYASNGDRFFTANNLPSVGGYNLWEHNKGNYGQFYDLLQLNPGDPGYANTVSDAYVTFFLNEEPYEDKKFDNLFIESIALDEAEGAYKHSDTFDRMQAWNETANTGEVPLVISYPWQPTDNVRRTNDQFQLAIPRDRVIDPYQNVLDPNNLINNGTFLPRMSGKWLRVKLTYGNTKGYRFSLNNIVSLYRKVFG